MSALETNNDLYLIAEIALPVISIPTAIMFVIWLFRARSNAESISPIPHRRHQAWTVFGWFTPIVSFWYPKQIVDDIWTTSMPGDQGVGDTIPTPLRFARRSGLVWAWWFTWLISMWVSSVAYRAAARGDEIEALLNEAKIDIYFLGPTLVCAALATAVVLKITNAQERQRHTYAPPLDGLPPGVHHPPGPR